MAQPKLPRFVGALASKDEVATIRMTFAAADGDWHATVAALRGKVPDDLLTRLDFGRTVAEHAGDKAIPELGNLRDFALKFSTTELAGLMPAPSNGTDHRPAAARELRCRLFHLQPSAVLQKMVADQEVPIKDAAVRDGVAAFLDRRPDFNIRTTSVLTALKDPGALDGIDEQHRPAVVEHLKTLQRVQAIAPAPEAIPALMKSNLTSAFRVSELPEATFVRAIAADLDEPTARATHASAIAGRLRNERTLMKLHEAVRGTGLAAIDGSATRADRLAVAHKTAQDMNVPVNLESLFGSIDYCECEDCLSVYSPAAYFVELLQYLRNNNLGPDPANPENPNPGIRTDPTDISGTPLEMLFRRRPDLGCLELTCQNTYTVLPYIDLVNEVLESFVVHSSEYAADMHTPKQATLEAFNVEDETSGELLAEPQHINDRAYCLLKDQVYPFTLPYHQPIDAIRVYLDYLHSSRRELIETFRTPHDPCADPSLTAALRAELDALHVTAIDRAVDAETLGMTEEEYVILTHEKFWKKHYFEIIQNKTLSDADYAALARVRTVQEYYGLQPADDLAATLTFVKREFLPRTGLLYVDLVALLRTRFINPTYPHGEALVYMESIRASYRYLQTLVKESNDPDVKYGEVIKLLEDGAALWPLLEAKYHPNPCKPAVVDCCERHGDIRKWVLCHFAKIGRLIVLESGDGPQLQLEGTIFEERDGPQFGENVGYLHRDGSITDLETGAVLGQVQVKVVNGRPTAGAIKWADGQSTQDKFGGDVLDLRDPNGRTIARIAAEAIIIGREPVRWMPTGDSCNLDKVRLVHLDGSAVTVDEFDRIQRFIRLWRKLAWSIDEVDQAIVGLAPKPLACAPDAGGCGDDGPDDCGDLAADGTCCDDDGAANVPATLTTDFLHLLADIVKLLDRTGLELAKLLTFWDDIGMAGDRPLYDRLFLTHNLVSLDPVFQRDANGNVLTTPTKLSEHQPVLLAALHLKPADLDSLRATVPLTDALTLANVSAIYRRTLLARLLSVRVVDLPKAVALSGDPFADPAATLDVLDFWKRMGDAGFTLTQMDFLVRRYDPAVPAGPDSPLTPSPKAVLQLCKTLYDGLTAIDHDHPDVTTEAPSDLVRASVGLILDPAVVEQVVALLEGTTVYSTNAPAGLTITIPDAIGATTDPETLKARLKYATTGTGTTATGSLQVTGILTDAEMARAKALSANAGWSAALDRVAKQRLNVFNDYLATFFDDVGAAKTNLLGGDRAATAGDPGTAPAKRLYFMQAFLPKLRQILDRRLIVDTLAGTVGLAKDVTELLLADILTVGTAGQSALALLQTIHDEPAAGGAGWTGFLIPPAAGDYIFTAIGDTAPPPLVIDGRSVPFTVQQDDPNNVWSTDPALTLIGGKLYPLTVADRQATEIQWRSATSPKAAIPTSALLPDQSRPGVTEVLVKLKQCALVVTGFTLDADEVRYWQQPPAFDFNAVTRPFWDRLQAYAALRDSLPTKDRTLLDLFAWAAKPDDPTKLAAQINAVTDWPADSVGKLITLAHFDLDRPDAFRDEVKLVQLQGALTVADRIGMDIDLLFDWARPTSRFKVCRQVADSIRAAVRARFSAEDYEQAVKPLRDKLRRDQRDALVAYLLVQPALVDWGVVDADSLFEFFLIDTQMDCCLETSRIKQAISSVQTYVQRCMLGLEDGPRGVGPDVLDRGRWDWLSREVIRTANRKVFINPENYLVASLRDDKSPFYKDLESELLQKDLNPQVVADALASFVHKVNDVANLKVVGLYADEGTDTDGSAISRYLHIFARTRNAPFLYWYRTFDARAVVWTPWTKVEVDIPNYDVTDNGVVKESGTYLLPRVWLGRLFLFFPQIVRKTEAPAPGKIDVPVDSKGNLSVTPPAPKDYWDVSMGWSEYRNGKWTTKQVSAGSKRIDAANFADVSKFKFTTAVDPGTDNNSEVVISIWNSGKGGQGGFRFNGTHLYADKAMSPALQTDATDFEYDNNNLFSTQVSPLYSPATLPGTPRIEVDNATVTLNAPTYRFGLQHPRIRDLMQQLSTNGTDGLYAAIAGLGADEDLFGSAPPDGTFNEQSRPNALYDWEVAFHAPMAIVDRLLKSQQFDAALNVIHYILDPLAKGTAPDRVWMFPPFKVIKPDTSVADALAALKPNTPDSAITDWRDHPFAPHVIARDRPVTYMKWVVMTYIEILIAYGDWYFRQNSLEAVPLAIQCYVLAAHLHGPRGQLIPKRGKTQPETYRSLLGKWDAFDNALVELELAAPFSNQTTDTIESVNGTPALPNVFGFATSLYFCVPDNPKLRTLRDTIDDRLFKIRHCQDIDGVTRQLPLFDPPIDPMLLVQATAAGLSLSSVLSDLNGPMPNYRFYYLLQKAQELCAELKSLGNAFLSAKEKHDAESLARLRASHESTMQSLVMEVRKQQLEEANKALEALQQSRKAPVQRMQYYLALVGDTTTKIPDGTADFSPVPNPIETPVDDGGLKLIANEKEEIDKAAEAADKQEDIGRMEALASILHIIPNLTINTQPVGVGISGTIFGGTMLGNALEALAKANQVVVGNRTYSSTSAGRKAGFQRALQDRIQQASAAGFEVANIDRQIVTQTIRQAIASQEINNQQTQIDNAKEVEDFLRNKYTSAELYAWMEGNVQGLYRQTYAVAYDLARRAEKVFRFERGLSTSRFIEPGYWDAGYDGLLAGERLHLALKQLEAAYQEKRGHDFEVTRHVSLRQVDPLALLQLRSTGACEFSLPEVLFDMDYPGHYQRRLKSVALSVPCVAGPYTGLNGTLRLLEHKFRTTALVNGPADYPEYTDRSDDRFSTVNVPISAIAASSGQNDSGVFELNFRDERYVPFEGAGAVSRWRLELPTQVRQFDYGTIADVILHVRYTALDGGDKLRGIAGDSVQKFLKAQVDLSRRAGLFALFDLRSDFPNEWTRLTQATGPAPGPLALGALADRLPFFTRAAGSKPIPATSAYLFWRYAGAAPKAPSLLQGAADPLPLGDASVIPLQGLTKTFGTPDGQDVPIDSTWKLQFDKAPAATDALWLIVKYALPG